MKNLSQGKPPKIATPEEYFAALRLIVGGKLDAVEATLHDESIRAFLSNTTPLSRRHLDVYAPRESDEISKGVCEEHSTRMLRISSAIRRKARAVGIYPKTEEEAHRGALIRDLMVQRWVEVGKLRVKEQGRVVRCCECHGWFHSIDTERVKPPGLTTYVRFCKRCAEKVKVWKQLYQAGRRRRF